jgi:RNA polymerase sigma factor (sigma-70 family)
MAASASVLRRAYARVVPALARRFGLDALAEVEDAVQDAMLAAWQSWPARGTPSDPAAWLYRVAYHQLVDRRRRAGTWARLAEARGEEAAPVGGAAPDAGARFGAEVGDEDLAMLFVVCDPALPVESQLVLALKIPCGLSVREIGLRLFCSEASVYKRLERGRRGLAEAGLAPATDGRLGSVLTVLYLLFTEGHSAARGDVLVRRELCDEALRLCGRLLEHDDQPATRALYALMLLQSARLSTRTDAAGELLTLAEQDRSRWDRAQIQAGLEWLQASASGDMFTRYHAEAAIAAEHCMAPSFEATRWEEIADLYRLLDRVAPSPLNHLNRAVALSVSRGAAAGLAALVGVRLPPGIAGYYLWDAVVGDLHRQAGDLAAARECLARAVERAPSAAERALIGRRLAACGEAQSR